MRGVPVLLVLLTGGCAMGMGARAGAGVARSTKPVTLMSPIGEGGSMADVSNSQEWMELEIHGGHKYVRGIFVLGGGNSHTRFRRTDGTVLPIYAKDDNFHARAGGGVALVSPALYGFRVAPYVIFNSNFGGQDNSATNTRELGIDLEWSQTLSKRSESTFVIGAALITETGPTYAELGGLGSQEGEFEVEGAMITFGWHYSIDLGKDAD